MKIVPMKYCMDVLSETSEEEEGKRLLYDALYTYHLLCRKSHIYTIT